MTNNRKDFKNKALWLDPVSALTTDDATKLEAMGLAPIPVVTIDDLKRAISVAGLAVIRLVKDTSLLEEVLEMMKGFGHIIPVVCRVDRRHFEIGIEAMRIGAGHVIPIDEWSEEAWQSPLNNMVDQSDPKRQEFVFVDPTSRKLLALAQKVAQAEVSTLLIGPSGSGKEVLARVLHEASTRCNGPFVALNCAAMPENLIEDMLFGHEKGAFTGAAKEHRGVFEQANGGSLFLDEIGDMPYHLQTKLLRVLQERRLTRLGAHAPIDLNVRLIAATNRDLKEAIQHRDFREDLYYRISAFRLRIPPLHERPGDILPLVEHLLKLHSGTGQRYILSKEAEAKLIGYIWPGNVRELGNVIQRALVLCPGNRITSDHLLFDELYGPVENTKTNDGTDSAFGETTSDSYGGTPVQNPDGLPKIMGREDIESLGAAVKTSEQQTIRAALRTCGSRVEAAKKLGISPRTLRYKIARYKDRGIMLAAND